MNNERKKVYKQLHSEIGNTELVNHELFPEQNNNILIKRELDNPFGTHYDRAYLSLFEHYEKTGVLKECSKVYETSTGSAGASYAGIGTRLGFECFAAMPSGGEKAREDALKKYLDDKHLFFTPAEDYVNGFPHFTSRFLVEMRKQYGKDGMPFFLNHSIGDKKLANEVTLKGFEDIANEIIDKKIPIDYFISAIGNGSSLLGVGRKLKEAFPNIKVIGFEPFQSALAFDKMYPGKYKELFSIEPGTLSRHQLPGLSYQTNFDIPHIDIALGGLLDDVQLVSDNKHDAEYKKLTGLNVAEKLPHWDDKNIGNTADYGRSTRAGLAVVKSLIAHGEKGKNSLVIAYDSKNRYDK